jgi:peptidoglycan hydrolase-like protein with peptidoglycan-binding domain
VYIGNGLAVECTPKWANGVQVTAGHNNGTKAGYNGRRWVKHGRLPYVTYNGTQEEKPATKPTTGATSTKEGYTVKMATLKPGSTHPHVKVLQALLIGNGYSCGKSGADGVYGSATKAALGKYQAEHKDSTGKPLAVDHVCGPATWGALLAQ